MINNQTFIAADDEHKTSEDMLYTDYDSDKPLPPSEIDATQIGDNLTVIGNLIQADYERTISLQETDPNFTVLTRQVEKPKLLQGEHALSASEVTQMTGLLTLNEVEHDFLLAIASYQTVSAGLQFAFMSVINKTFKYFQRDLERTFAENDLDLLALKLDLLEEFPNSSYANLFYDGAKKMQNFDGGITDHSDFMRREIQSRTKQVVNIYKQKES